MAVNVEVPWDCAPRMGAKHDIYQRYLERWFHILLAGAKAYPSVTYAEGFSGPGVYKGGEPGSPLIAFRALVTKVSKTKGIARFAFIDDDQRCVDLLRTTLTKEFPERPRSDAAMPVKTVKGACANHLEATVARTLRTLSPHGLEPLVCSAGSATPRAGERFSPFAPTASHP
jgi:three-Cys-motif partner protein